VQSGELPHSSSVVTTTERAPSCGLLGRSPCRWLETTIPVMGMGLSSRSVLRDAALAMVFGPEDLRWGSSPELPRLVVLFGVESSRGDHLGGLF
jgi:hypothetical protein